MHRGRLMVTNTVLKRTYQGWKLIRRCLVQIDELELFDNLCCRCDFCSLICPREALSFKEREDGSRDHLQVNPQECSFCGYCVAFCPFKAFDLRSNGNKVVPIIEHQVFYPLVLEGQVEVSLSDATQKCTACHVCVAQCPRNAITLKMTGGIPKLQVNFDKCAGCNSCAVNCAMDIIKAHTAFEGEIEINFDEAQRFGEELSEICPMGCFAVRDNGELTFSDETCIFCGACQYVPNAPKNMVIVHRTSIRTLPGFSPDVTNAISKSFLST